MESISKNVIDNLLDAVISINLYKKEKSDYENFSAMVDSRKETLDSLILELKNVLTNFDATKAGVNFDDAKAKIIDFATMAIQQVKEKINKQSKDDAGNLKQKMDSDLNKAMGSLNLFLSNDPFKIIDYTVYLKNTNNSYEGRVLYRCDDNISYEFTLNSGLIPGLKADLYSSSIVKGIKLPVRKGKSLMSQEIAVDYEKMDKYFIKYGELSPKYLTLTIFNSDTGSSINFFYPVEKPEMMKIVYRDESGEVEVENDPVLNKYIDYSAIKSYLNNVISLLRDLMSKRKSVSALKFNDQDLFESNDFSKLMIYAITKYRDIITGDIQKGIITKDMIINRIANIDENTSKQVMQLLGITSSPEKSETNSI